MAPQAARRGRRIACRRRATGGARLLAGTRGGRAGLGARARPDGTRAMVLGFSAQWADPVPDAPFRYGGAVRPAPLPPESKRQLGEAARQIVTAGGLVGLNSVDFLVGADGLASDRGQSAAGRHARYFQTGRAERFSSCTCEACRGQLPSAPPDFAGAAAARIVYARRDMPSVPEFAWPDWTADRQPAGTSVARRRAVLHRACARPTIGAGGAAAGRGARARRSLAALDAG